VFHVDAFARLTVYELEAVWTSIRYRAQARIGINGDGIAFLHQRDISTHHGFGRGGAPI